MILENGTSYYSVLLIHLMKQITQPKTNPMKNLRSILFFCLLFSYALGNAQKKSSMYFITPDDTVYCKTLNYNVTAQGFLNKLEYTDMQGKKQVFKGKENVPNILTFFINGKFIDKTPLDPSKPESYVRYNERTVNGKLIVYVREQGHNDQMNGPSGTYRFFIKMANGKFYDINKKNIESTIKPYLLKCDSFKQKYKGDYSAKEQPFMAMIKLYNSLCGAGAEAAESSDDN
jgi:hypothetical protein